MLTILKLVIANRKSLYKAILGLSVGFLLAWSTFLHKENKRLSESLEMALNNIEAYLGSLQESWLANNVLKLDLKTLHEQNDKLLLSIDSVRKELKIKSKQITTAATQKLVFYVNDSKGVGGDLVEILKDTVYKDSIKYNDLTTVYYTIGRDTVNVGIDLQNTLYLYVYTDKLYKNKKRFIKRLFTLDFKKVKQYKYNIVNTNDLIKSEDVRVVESNK